MRRDQVRGPGGGREELGPRTQVEGLVAHHQQGGHRSSHRGRRLLGPGRRAQIRGRGLEESGRRACVDVVELIDAEDLDGQSAASQGAGSGSIDGRPDRRCRKGQRGLEHPAAVGPRKEDVTGSGGKGIDHQREDGSAGDSAGGVVLRGPGGGVDARIHALTAGARDQCGRVLCERPHRAPEETGARSAPAGGRTGRGCGSGIRIRAVRATSGDKAAGAGGGAIVGADRIEIGRSGHDGEVGIGDGGRRIDGGENGGRRARR